MNKYYTFIILLLLLTSVCFTSAAYATDADVAAGKCLTGTHVVKIIKGNFSSSTSPQRVIVTRKMESMKGGALCNYHIAWEFFIPITHTWLSEGSGWTYPGPGLVFFNGLWQPPMNAAFRLKVEPVQVLDKRTQLAIYHESGGNGGTYSDLAIYAFIGGYEVPKILLHVADMDPLIFSVEHNVVDIKGDYFGPNACNSCGLHGYEVKLKYDSDAGQMAIVDQDHASDMFYASILRNGGD